MAVAPPGRRPFVDARRPESALLERLVAIKARRLPVTRSAKKAKCLVCLGNNTSQ